VSYWAEDYEDAEHIPLLHFYRPQCHFIIFTKILNIFLFVLLKKLWFTFQGKYTTETLQAYERRKEVVHDARAYSNAGSKWLHLDTTGHRTKQHIYQEKQTQVIGGHSLRHTSNKNKNKFFKSYILHPALG
jgi:hypothetical protein